MKKYLLHPATFKLDGGAMFGIIPKPLWERKIKADEQNRILMSLRVVFLDLGTKKVLIDTGIGDYHSEKFNHQFEIKGEKTPLVKILKENFNLSPSDITDIILTHLHFDHVGGLGSGTNGTEIIFPNATIHLHQKHFTYAQNATARDAGSFHTHTFMPLLNAYQAKNQLHLLHDDEGLILEEGIEKIEYRISKGHTPYMIHPIFDSYIYMADLVPMNHHVSIPWVMGYDIEPGVTTVYKEKFFDFIDQNQLKMIYEHDLETSSAGLQKDEAKGFVPIDLKNSSGVVEELI